MYICSSCKKETKELDSKFVRCQHCGHRVLYKRRAPVAKNVSTD